MKPSTAKYIWYDHQVHERNLYGLFRKTFEVTDRIDTATLHIFADTSYQIFVNSKFIGFGPVRFDPEFPVYDTYNLAPYLVHGKNAIAVIINHFGCKTYKSINNSAGMVAWGTVRTTSGEEISLDTKQEDWRCFPSLAHSHYAPKISFALNPAERYDQRLESARWKEVDFDDSGWPLAVELDHQNAWGQLSPRPIPFMPLSLLPGPDILQILPLCKDEELYSFSVPIPHFFEDNKAKYSNFVAFTTWIYSPVDQIINAGVFWGENWLNGIEIPHGVDSHNKNMRITQRWDLKKGWNHLFGKVGGYLDILDHYFALPKDKGLILSVQRDESADYSFKHTPILDKESYEKYIKDKPLPYGPEENLEEIGGWVLVPQNTKAQNPCRETSWDMYRDPVETLTCSAPNGHTFRHSDYPEGFSILFDLGHMHLFFPQLCMEGTEGTIVDITFSERLAPDSAHLLHTFNYCAGDRIFCSRNRIDWLCVHPRGARYMKVTVRNMKKDITLHSLNLLSANYPVESKGYFNCSDPLLNGIWQMGARTQRANMEDAYVDCSGRERGMYIRDTIIQYHNNLAAFGDHALMKRCIELYGQSPDDTGKFRAVYPNSGDYTISDFSLNMVEGYLAYYEHTGDINLIKQDWEVITNNLQWFHALADEREDLLLDAEWHTQRGIQAHYGGFHGDLGLPKGYLDNTGIHCVFSCTYLISMQCALKLAKALGKAEDEAILQKRIDLLAKNIPEKFWDNTKGCFADNLEGTSHSAHASLFAVRAGVVEDAKLDSVKKYVSNMLRSIFVNGYSPEDGVLISPNFAFYIFDGLFKAGLSETALHIIRQGWGWMLAKGMKTCPEYFSARPNQSMCHAWSASPTYYLSIHVLGVRFPKAPYMDEIEIKVQAPGITHAEGAYPHPKGLIEVKWHMEGDIRIFDYIRTPEGVHVIEAI